MISDLNLVYSTDQSLNKKCDRCKQLASECNCKSPTIDNSKIISKIRLEKAHRNGKIVTVIDNLPASDDFLGELAQILKKNVARVELLK